MHEEDEVHVVLHREDVDLRHIAIVEDSHEEGLFVPDGAELPILLSEPPPLSEAIAVEEKQPEPEIITEAPPIIEEPKPQQEEQQEKEKEKEKSEEVKEVTPAITDTSSDQKEKEASPKKPSPMDSKPVKAVKKAPPEHLLAKARSKSPMKTKPPLSSPSHPVEVEQSPLLVDVKTMPIIEGDEGPSTQTSLKVPPLDLDSPAIRKTAVIPVRKEIVTSPPPPRSPIIPLSPIPPPPQPVTSIEQVVDYDLIAERIGESLSEEIVAERAREAVETAIVEITAERMAELEEEVVQLAIDSVFEEDFEESFEDCLDEAVEEFIQSLVEEEMRAAEISEMSRADEEAMMIEVVERQREEEEKIARQRQREIERAARLEAERVAGLEKKEREDMSREEQRERQRLALIKQQRADQLIAITETGLMKSNDFNINWIKRHFLEEIRRAKIEEEERRLALEEEEKKRADQASSHEKEGGGHKRGKRGYYKIKSGQPTSSNNRVFQRNTLTPMLNRAIRRQPVASSLATVIAADLQSPITLEEITGNSTTIRTPFAYDSAEELKTVLENLDAHSLGSAGQSIQHYMTNLHKQPSWIHEHKGPKKAKKIQYSSTFNALYSDEENSSLAGSVAKSLSSTSWANGKFSIEKSVVEATNIGQGGTTTGPQQDSSHSAANTARSLSPSMAESSLTSADKTSSAAAGGGGRKRGASPAEGAEEGLYIQSVKQVQRLGYVPTLDHNGKSTSKRPWAYAAHWQRLLTDFLAAHAVGSIKRSHNPQVGFDLTNSEGSDGEGASLSSSIGSSFTATTSSRKHVQRPPFWELKKKIKALEKAISSNSTVFATKNVPMGANPRLKAGMLSVEEIICALAETRGSVGEVITRLSDHNLEFISEIQLVCSALNVKSMVCALPGGSELFEIELETAARQHASPLKALFLTVTDC